MQLLSRQLGLYFVESVRSVGFNVNILDANAEGLKEDQISREF